MVRTPGHVERIMTEIAHNPGLVLFTVVNARGRELDIGELVTFLASPLAGYITGTELHVNGGMYMS